ncbi:phospholipase A1-like [Solenopsis invicta]|uniref:phospholipase A1-like n=1 Tax=Solenopsis invicta TaxID=13686 RepID=UPI0005960CB6|nr:phospholipase A1-like [Solenopsis invicta]
MKTFVATLVVLLIQCTHLIASKSCEDPESIVINVYLYNNKFPDGKNLGNQQSCQDIDASLPVVIITHGFTSSANDDLFRNLAKAFVQKGHTALIVDWSQAACSLLIQYPTAVENTRKIGPLIANYTIDMINTCKTPLENMKFVGHSLGSHVCGFAAKQIKRLTNETVPTILCLDPAKPEFGGNPCEERVCKEDTKRMVVFKTSILGISDPIGHLNLQFGNGLTQPACWFIDINCHHTESITYATDMVDEKCLRLAVPFDAFSYPTADTQDCLVVNSNILKPDNTAVGQKYVYTDCAENTFKCKKE